MVIRQRAIQAEDKQERRDAILDAAERVLLRSPERVASVAEVAHEAGLAKGTVYLYFPSKEELLLAVHERRINAFFRATIALLERDTPTGFDDMLALAYRHMVEPPLFLPLATRGIGLMAHSIPFEAAVASMQRIAAGLERAGAGLERHFPQLGRGGGVPLLRRSYALIIGLWQLFAEAGGDPMRTALTEADALPAVVWSFRSEMDRALRVLWRGAVGGAPAGAAGEGRP
jgi:AcrR family transcriptional regulator